MKIAVLAGGTSTERDVSLISGKNIYEALKRRGHQAVLLDIYVGYDADDYADVFEMDKDWAKEIHQIGVNAPDLKAVEKLRPAGYRGFFGPNVIRICEMADIVFMGLHGANGEDGKVQAALELHGIKFTGSGFIGAALSMDKGITKQIFRQNNIPTPQMAIDNNVSNTTNITFASNSFIFLKCENKTLGTAFTNSSIGKVSMPDIAKNKMMLPTDLYVKPNIFINAPPKSASNEIMATITATIIRKPINLPRMALIFSNANTNLQIQLFVKFQLNRKQFQNEMLLLNTRAGIRCRNAEFQITNSVTIFGITVSKCNVLATAVFQHSVFVRF